MKIYIVKHWCESNILGAFDTEEKAMECVKKHQPEENKFFKVSEEYNIVTYVLNKECSEEDVYIVR